MIFYVAAIAAVLLTGLFVFATEASSRAKLVVGGLVGVSVLIQFGVGASWALPGPTASWRWPGSSTRATVGSRLDGWEPILSLAGRTLDSRR